MLAEVIDEENTSQDSLPTGEAEYNGVIILGNAEDDGGVAGDLRLTVDFADLDVGGSVTNVADSDGRTYAGTLDVGEDYAPGASYVDPTVDQNDGWLFGADFGGALSQGGDTYLVDGYLDGGIAGPDGEYAGGEAYAESCTVSIGCTDYFGAFIAEGGAASP